MAITQENFRNFTVKFHRNGTWGMPFFCCRFWFCDEDNRWHNMTAIVAEPNVFVTSDEANQRWDGGAFKGAIREAIAAVEKSQPETIYSR